MKAVQIEEFGGPEVLKTAEIPTPEAGEDEVLIELRASGVNRPDILTRIGSYHAAGQPPIVPGFEGRDPYNRRVHGTASRAVAEAL